jgi:hypothetical protein
MQKILLPLLFLMCTNILGMAQTSSGSVLFDIIVVEKEDDQNAIALMKIDPGFGVLKNSSGVILRPFEEGDGDEDQILATFLVTDVLKDRGVARIKIAKSQVFSIALYTHVAQVDATFPKSNYYSSFFMLRRYFVSFNDVEEESLFNPRFDDAAFYDEEAEWNSLSSLVVDIHRTGAAMLEQMDDILIEQGPYEGLYLLDMMQQITIDDLLAFFSYIEARPTKYSNSTWKISEVFATWVVEGAPVPEETEAVNVEISTKGVCPELIVDLTKGTLNGLDGKASMVNVKKVLPCFTGETEEGAGYNRGGGVFYLDHDFFMYTGMDCINIRDKFQGKGLEKILGANLKDAIKLLGKLSRSESDMSFVNTKFGCIGLLHQDGVVQEIYMWHGRNAESITFDDWR